MFTTSALVMETLVMETANCPGEQMVLAVWRIDDRLVQCQFCKRVFVHSRPSYQDARSVRSATPETTEGK